VRSKPKLRLLIVDDDRAIRSLPATVAKRAGFSVDLAKDGVDALEMLDQSAYDIAIVDLMMPRLSGYELVQKISARNPRPAVIVATALTNGDTKSLEDSMVRRVIRKPFDIEAVAKALIETAVQVAQERSAEPIPIAPPEAAKLQVIVEPGAAAEVKIEVKPIEENATKPNTAPPPEEKK
jgi:DNA-binding response OmpR family regulator